MKNGREGSPNGVLHIEVQQKTHRTYTLPTDFEQAALLASDQALIATNCLAAGPLLLGRRLTQPMLDFALNTATEQQHAHKIIANIDA